MAEKLSQLKKSESAVILDFLDHKTVDKLIEMGCLPGEIIFLDEVAPLGCPLIFKIGDSKISMRKAEAQTIIVRKII